MSSLVFVGGARPNFVKLAPILRAAKRAGFACELVHTGQHYDFGMSGVFFEQLAIPEPDAHLQVGSGSHGEQTGRIMIAFEQWLLARKQPPLGVVVVGDVNSTLACALVAVKLGIRVAHVEAGLRSRDRSMPEEINRIATDAVSDLLLVSEPSGLANLAQEGISRDRVVYTGNVMIDTLVEQLPAARELSMPARFGQPYAAVTLHRPSNVDRDDRLAHVIGFLRNVAALVPVVFPLHPRTAARLDATGLRKLLDEDARIRTCEPLGYREFLGLMEGARLVITDSGGVQEETTYMGVPCVTLRSNTERPATTEQGTNVLVGDDLEKASSVIRTVLESTPRSRPRIDGWDGNAAPRIVDALRTAWT